MIYFSRQKEAAARNLTAAADIPKNATRESGAPSAVRLISQSDDIMTNTTNGAIRIRVFAKINLFLRIVGKRPDHFHEIDTLMHPIGLWDELEVQALPEVHAPASGLSLECEGVDLADPEKNTVGQMYFLMKKRFPNEVPACRICLRKTIPMQAGMGGGSADAAGALLALERLAELNLRAEERNEIASAIGSDVAFFLGNAPAIAKGRGERIEMVQGHLQSPVVLVTSRNGVSTAEAYSRFSPDPAEDGLSSEKMAEAVRAGDERLVADRLHNSFERLIYPLRPDLRRIRGELLGAGARGAMMTGSGATVFALGMDGSGMERAREVLNQMDREMVCTSLQPHTYEWVQ